MVARDRVDARVRGVGEVIDALDAGDQAVAHDVLGDRLLEADLGQQAGDVGTDVVGVPFATFKLLLMLTNSL